ncbi:ABC-2 type transport system permease protein [Mobilisporobacter senegalensis]|uniref:Transport permease protein n=1 Tax=Mobilisporobacter senegalensis TaxID=1329262 RepID=A0A3N1XQL4_9FIRM|nr:ABC transporter permease [Mobilisporobacter senegalensis]ROR28441.1 ABC-2 type transport system permease protein [Mobilisporobacter senegalensis]
MKTIFSLTFKSASRDPFLLLWSLILPIGGAIGLGIFIKSPDYPEHILTGMMAVSVLFYALTTTSFTILTQRRRGVYNLLRVTPMPLWRYVCSISGAWTIISFLCAVLVMLSGILALKLSVSIATILALLPTLMIAALGYVLLSFFIASLSRTENNVSILTNIITLPLIFSSSTFYSLDNAPGFIQILNKCNPFQWFVNALRGAFNLSWSDYFINTGLVLLVAIVAFLLALKTFRYTDV